MGSIGVKAYADYNPGLALKYVKNVLNNIVKMALPINAMGALNRMVWAMIFYQAIAWPLWGYTRLFMVSTHYITGFILIRI